MTARFLTRVLLAFVLLAQTLAPFLHAHEGPGGVGAGGPPLHLHLSAGAAAQPAIAQTASARDAIAGAVARPQAVPDEGRVVGLPPEYRREGLQLGDLPLATGRDGLLVAPDAARRHELCAVTTVVVHATPHFRWPARGPPVA